MNKLIEKWVKDMKGSLQKNECKQLINVRKDV